MKDKVVFEKEKFLVVIIIRLDFGMYVVLDSIVRILMIIKECIDIILVFIFVIENKRFLVVIGNCLY